MHTHKINKHLISALLLISSFMHSHAALADEAAANVKKARWYQINITFFQQQHDRKLDESFNFEGARMTMADSLSLHKDGNYSLANSGFNAPLALHHENLNGLSFTEQDIDESWIEIQSKLDPVKQPILFNAQWVQPVYEEKYSLPLYFESSLNSQNQSQLKGLLHLHVSRYLHSKIELQYLPKDANSHSEIISLTQKRRMRSKEVHYLDHPLVGALIRILPHEHPLTTQEKLLEQQQLEKNKEAQESALNARL